MAVKAWYPLVWAGRPLLLPDLNNKVCGQKSKTLFLNPELRDSTDVQHGSNIAWHSGDAPGTSQFPWDTEPRIHWVEAYRQT